MTEEISALFSNVGVKRRVHRRTPWRRTYSYVEPSSLLYANTQDSGWPSRHYEATRNLCEGDSDRNNNNKQPVRMNSTRYITLTTEWSDVRTLKNRDVSINLSRPVKVLDLESILDPRLRSNPQPYVMEEKSDKAYDLKAARRRRHTVSRIEYTIPVLPISEVNEEKSLKSYLVNSSGVSCGRSRGDNDFQSLSQQPDVDVQQNAVATEGSLSINDSCIRTVRRQGSVDKHAEISKGVLDGDYKDSVQTGTSEAKETCLDGSPPLDSSSDEEGNSGFYGRHSKSDFAGSLAIDKYTTAEDLTQIYQTEETSEISRMENTLEQENSENRERHTKIIENGSNLGQSTDCDSAGNSAEETPIENNMDAIGSLDTLSSSTEISDVFAVAVEEVRATVLEMLQEVEQKLDHNTHRTKSSLDETNSLNGDNEICRFWVAEQFSRRVSEPTIRSPIFQIRSKLRGNVHKKDKSVTVKSTKTDDGAIREKDVFTRLYQLAVAAIGKTTKRQPKISDLIVVFQSKGIWISDLRLKKTCELIEQEPLKEETELLEDVFMRICSPAILFIRNILLGQMAIPGFTLFASKMEQVFQALRSAVVEMESKEIVQEDSSVNPRSNYLDFMLSRRSAKDGSISMSVCTVDGQRLRFGDNENIHPLDACANVLNYCIACRQNGLEIMKSHIGKTPLTDCKNEFMFDESGKVLNPFTKAGAIMTSALLSQTESVNTSISELHDFYSKSMADEAICCDNLSYNLKRLYAHEEISLAYFLSARHKLSKMYNATPGDILELNFQSSSTASTSDACSVAAATLAAGGVCPLTGETVFKEELVHHALKRVRASSGHLKDKNDKRVCPNDSITFTWSESGSIFIVVPGVLGLVCFVQSQPRKIVRELVICLVQNLDTAFNFSVYRNLRDTRK